MFQASPSLTRPQCPRLRRLQRPSPRRPANQLGFRFRRRQLPTKIGVVIPTYNQFEYAKIAVDSLLANTANCLAILVDDGSPDWNKAMWEKYPSNKLLLYRFPKNDKNLTRSWNKGIELALDHRCQVIVAGNSDLKFPPRWEEGLVEALDAGAGSAGPTTNAPGHRTRQNVKLYHPNYKVKDSDAHIAAVSEYLLANHVGHTEKGPLNGFCIAAKAETWTAGAYSLPHAFFNPKYKMTRNEDELMGRWRKLGFTSVIACSSFVFHYRGVTRNPSGKNAGSGHKRLN